MKILPFIITLLILALLPACQGRKTEQETSVIDSTLMVVGEVTEVVDSAECVTDRDSITSHRSIREIMEELEAQRAKEEETQDTQPYRVLYYSATYDAQDPDEAYEEGYERGYEQGLEDGQNGEEQGCNFDDSCDYYGEMEEQYTYGYEEGYNIGYEEGHEEYISSKRRW